MGPARGAALAVLVVGLLGLAAWAGDPASSTSSAARTSCTAAVPALATVTDEVVHYLRGEPVDATALDHALGVIRPITQAPPPQIADQLQAQLEIGDQVVAETRAGTHGVINGELYRSSGTVIAQFCAVHSR